MFSRNHKSSSKNEIVGVFRNLFKGSSRKEISSNQADGSKGSLRHRIRARFSFKRSSSHCEDSKWTSSTPHEPAERRGRPKAMSPLLDNTENSLNVSSILKQPNCLRLTNKKRLRFEDDSLKGYFCNENKNTPIQDETEETVVLHSMESDERYYKMMKEEILERSRDSSMKRSVSKPERKTKSNGEDLVNISTLQLLYDDNLESEGFTANCEEFIHFFRDSECASDTKSGKFVPKIGAAKKYKDKRFNPMAKEQSCAVVVLKGQQNTSQRMSWCSA